MPIVASAHTVLAIACGAATATAGAPGAAATMGRVPRCDRSDVDADGGCECSRRVYTLASSRCCSAVGSNLMLASPCITCATSIGRTSAATTSSRARNAAIHRASGATPSRASAHSMLPRCCGAKRGIAVSATPRKSSSHASGGSVSARAAAHTTLDRCCGSHHGNSGCSAGSMRASSSAVPPAGCSCASAHSVLVAWRAPNCGAKRSAEDSSADSSA
eukprot:242102-Chlamydomonas_euryale.AAC.1